jgi:hypothetical protein
MIMRDEHRELEQVRSRLIERFPQVPAETVQLTVHDVHSKFDGRIRDYVPILVEREARNRLAAIAAGVPLQAGT